jgi:hypothetical protein
MKHIILVLEKSTGKVQRVINGKVQATVLDLAVNFASERGLLGIALHPGFPRNPRVSLLDLPQRNRFGQSLLPERTRML